MKFSLYPGWQGNQGEGDWVSYAAVRRVLAPPCAITAGSSEESASLQVSLKGSGPASGLEATCRCLEATRWGLNHPRRFGNRDPQGVTKPEFGLAT